MRFNISRRAGLAMLCVAGLTVLAWFHGPVLAAAARWLDVGAAPQQVDYVMVLPGGAEQRPFVAVAMVHAGLAREILTAQTETDPANDEGLTETTDVVIRRVLRLRGIRDDQIHILPGNSLSTWTDALALRTFMQAHPEATVAIVTDAYHTRRSRWVFNRVLGSDASRVSYVSATNDEVSPESWWKTEKGLMIYSSEFCKLIAYVITDKGTVQLLGCIGVATMIAAFLYRKLVSVSNRLVERAPMNAGNGFQSQEGARTRGKSGDRTLTHSG